MARTAHPVLLWTPRVLGVAMSIFIGLFALDAFQAGMTFRQAVGAFAIHLVPAAALLVVALAAFRWPLIGTVAFIALAVAYGYWARHHLSWILAISWPLFVIGVLFLISWMYEDAPRHA